MAKASGRASTVTTLVIGQVKVAVGLFSTVADPSKVAKFDTAGPNGGVLHARPMARPVPVSEQTDESPDVPVHSVDPLADDLSFAEALDAFVADPGPDEDRVGYPKSDEDAGAPFVTSDPRGLTGERSGPMVDRVPDPSVAAAVISETLDHAPSARPSVAEGHRNAPSTGLEVTGSAVPGEYGSELVEDGTGVVVPPQDVRRGVRLEDGRFIDCTEQLAAIDEQTRLEQMEVLGFVDITRVPRARVKGAKYIGAADEQAPVALRLLFEALQVKRRGAVVKLTKTSRQTLGVIGWLRGCLVLYELVFAEDFREPPARASRIQKVSVSDAMVDRMVALIDSRPLRDDAFDALRDDAIGLREELKGKALAGEVARVVDPRPAAEAGADDVLAQLEASLAAVQS